MKEYRVEDGDVDIGPLTSPLMDESSYVKAHQSLVLCCHDVFIRHGGGILLVRRKTLPAIGILWPLGGRVLRGVPLEDSMRQVLKRESGLGAIKMDLLGFARTFFRTDPFGHGKGTDSMNAIFFAESQGTLRLDTFHEEPIIVTPEDYPSMRESLHPYVRDFMDLAIPLVK